MPCQRKKTAAIAPGSSPPEEQTRTCRFVLWLMASYMYFSFGLSKPYLLRGDSRVPGRTGRVAGSKRQLSGGVSKAVGGLVDRTTLMLDTLVEIV
jgi:hypothetical protein